MIRILPADQQLPQAAELACQLWPSHSREELHATLQDAISDGGAVLLALEGERPVDFAQCALRRDYVEGSSTSRSAIWRVSLSCRSTAAAALPAGWWTPARAGRSCRAARSLPATASLIIWKANGFIKPAALPK